MKPTPVESSMIHAVGYDEDARELEVEFTNGSIYRYVDVDKEEHEGLLAADSKGRYMHSNILDCYMDYQIARRGRRR